MGPNREGCVTLTHAEFGSSSNSGHPTIVILLMLSRVQKFYNMFTGLGTVKLYRFSIEKRLVGPEKAVKEMICFSGTNK